MRSIRIMTIRKIVANKGPIKKPPIILKF